MVTVINEDTGGDGGGGGGGGFSQDPVEFGENASADDGAMAVGVDAGAFAEGAVALGDGTTVSIEDVAGLGPRDLFLTDGRSIIYPSNQGPQTVANNPITDSAPEGERHSLLFSVADETVLEAFAEADGVGGVQNISLDLPGDLDVSGDAEAEDILAKAIEIGDADGNTFFAVDAGGATTALQLAGNDIDGLNKINPSNDELLVDGDVTISGELTEGASF